MAAQMPKTYQEQQMVLLQNIAAAKAAPDANLDELTQLEQQVLASLRKPYDTASQGTPVGSSMDMSQGAAAPTGPAPGQLSPMLAALMSAGGGAGAPGPTPGPPPAAAGSFPVRGVAASAAPPNMDEVRRMLTVPGGRNG